MHHDQGRLPEAAELAAEALAGRRVALRAAHPDTLASLQLLAAALQDQGDGGAEPLLRELLAEQSAALGDGHAATLGTVRYLLRLLLRGTPVREAEACDVAEEALRRLPAAPDAAARKLFGIFAKALESCSHDGCRDVAARIRAKLAL